MTLQKKMQKNVIDCRVKVQVRQESIKVIQSRVDLGEKSFGWDRYQ